jgi:hypothetical protein
MTVGGEVYNFRSRGTSVEIWRRIEYTVHVVFEVFVFAYGVCYSKPTLNCYTLASIQLMNGMLMNEEYEKTYFGNRYALCRRRIRGNGHGA